jgi:hypothetical protein
MKVYQAIASVMADMAKDGISKDRKNQQQGYAFRGIDDFYNALSPLLAKHGLCILPRVLSRESTERQTKSGGALFYTVVDVEFDMVAAEDGSKHTIRTYGEAMDSADKSTNKALSAAYKYAAMQAFCIPTEGDNDADRVTYEVAAKTQAKPQPQKAPPKTDGNPFDDEPDLSGKTASAEHWRGMVNQMNSAREINDALKQSAHDKELSSIVHKRAKFIGLRPNEALKCYEDRA